MTSPPSMPDPAQLDKITKELADLAATTKAMNDKLAALTAKFKAGDLSMFATTSQIPGIDQIITHPVEGRHMVLRTAIMDLNDGYRWTREQIADWLDTLDNQPTF